MLLKTTLNVYVIIRGKRKIGQHSINIEQSKINTVLFTLSLYN